MPIIILTVVIFALTGWLWYERPSPNVWLFGSLGLGVVWSVIFMRLITRGHDL